MKIIKWIFNRVLISGILILLQLFLFFYFIFDASKETTYAYLVLDVLTFLITLYIINRSQEPSLKLSWLIIILLVPLVGVPLYLMFSSNHISKKYIQIYTNRCPSDTEENRYKHVIKEIESKDAGIASQFKYIHNTSLLPVVDGTRSEYLSSGEKFFDKLLQELKKAKKYIFMEYYIIEEGKMWNSILTILKKKVDEGVDVRIIYDDLGCIKTLPYNYDKKLRKFGIKCYKFNHFIPVVSANHNNRNHRKITIIDGKVGFISGANLADEYINEKVKYGHWKDCAIFLEGKAVDNLLSIFMPTYNAITRKKEDVNEYMNSDYIQANSYTHIFGTGPKPAYQDYIAEDVCINFINSANKYLYITTPYLIADYNVMHSLELAAKRGVDVRIIVPGIPDKKIIYMMTKQSYETLLKAGVKIYEYTPGFIHAKEMIADNDKAIISTVNLDYRSMIHNFECGVYLYNDETINDMYNEYLDVIEDCREVDIKDCKVKWYVSLFRKSVSFLAPLL